MPPPVVVELEHKFSVPLEIIKAVFAFIVPLHPVDATAPPEAILIVPPDKVTKPAEFKIVEPPLPVVVLEFKFSVPPEMVMPELAVINAADPVLEIAELEQPFITPVPERVSKPLDENVPFPPAPTQELAQILTIPPEIEDEVPIDNVPFPVFVASVPELLAIVITPAL